MVKQVDEQFLEIVGHLGAALIQQAPSDDKIIMDHVRSANEIAVNLRRQIMEYQIDMLEALRGTLNYLENTECELGITLDSANRARAAIAKANSQS